MRVRGGRWHDRGNGSVAGLGMMNGADDSFKRNHRVRLGDALPLAVAVVLVSAVLWFGTVAVAHASHGMRPIRGRAAYAVVDVSGKTVPASPTDYDSWSAVGQSVGAQLDGALRTYRGGDCAFAASQISQAQNVTYVASNLVSQIAATLGTERQAQESQAFQSLQNLARTPGQETELAAQISALKQDLVEAASALDGNPAVAKPRAYAKQREQKTKAERKKLQKEKKTKFTGKGSRSWSDVASEMDGILDDAVKATKAGDARKGSDKVNEAYYQYYEKLGFEKNVMNAISGSRVSLVESTFKDCRKSMIQGESVQTVQGHVTTLKGMLNEDAKKLDGGAEENVSGFTKFITSSIGQAFIILVREGLEALLVVAAIIAYLVKSGNKRFTKWIYVGVLVGLLGSGLMAVLFGVLFSGNGPQQEIMEGVVALIAMVMLLYTSNWMLSKSSVDKWNDYIRGKTEKTVQGVAAADRLRFSGMVSLAMLSFLAVFREGAETVMFYESIYSMTRDSRGMWIGGIAAAVVLVVIFAIFRLTSVHIPIRPFFVITSILMALLVVIFAGGGVHSLIEGNLIAGTYLPSMPTSDWLGLYPYAETIAAQVVMAVVVVALYVVFALREHREKQQVNTRPMNVADSTNPSDGSGDIHSTGAVAAADAVNAAGSTGAAVS